MHSARTACCRFSWWQSLRTLTTLTRSQCERFVGSTSAIYRRLKRRGVIVVSGEYFFPGLDHDAWKHKEECIRISYADRPEKVAQGIAIVSEEVARAYDEASPNDS